MISKDYTLGIDVGSTTVKVALIDSENNIIFSDYERHFADISKTLQGLTEKAMEKNGIAPTSFYVPPETEKNRERKA